MNKTTQTPEEKAFEIRPVIKDDLKQLKEILDSSGLFPSEYLEEMISDYLNRIDSEDIWFTYSKNNMLIGFGYCTPEKLTEGTYNLLAIAVRQEFQGQRIGSAMMAYLEKYLKENGKRILIVETSSLDLYMLTRKFYLNLGYAQEAVIRDFWNEGEDKVIYRKKLNV
jgi:ribosomal protein S18 acetylase RimI-like enzyme